MTKVVTRFAPSPTGFLHIGGARTALFNWLFARHHGGKFLLRIEDTDSARSNDDATKAIIEGMKWLGLDYDAPIVFQSKQINRHREVANELLSTGKAYHCYMSKDEIEIEKKTAREQNRRFHSPWRDIANAQMPTNTPCAIRLKSPIDGKTVINDQVQGKVQFQNQQLDDLILLRSDGSPTYMLAVVVDDHDMKVTHIIRGDDHLVNAARQALIYQALDWNTPEFAHIPLIHGPDGKKLSKRHGALGVEAYRDMGYLPEAINNYLLRLGWAHGDQEFFTTEQAITAFSLPAINKGPSRLDFEKMAHINSHYIKVAENQRLADIVFEYLSQNYNQQLDHNKQSLIRKALPYLLTRVKTIADIIDQIGFLLQNRPIDLSPKGKKTITAERLIHLKKLRSEFELISDWNQVNIENLLQSFAKSQNIGFGLFGPILRWALTGGKPAPDLAVTCYLLGRKETLSRIDDLLDLQVL